MATEDLWLTDRDLDNVHITEEDRGRGRRGDKELGRKRQRDKREEEERGEERRGGGGGVS